MEDLDTFPLRGQIPGHGSSEMRDFDPAILPCATDQKGTK